MYNSRATRSFLSSFDLLKQITCLLRGGVDRKLPVYSSQLYRGTSLIRKRHPVGPYSRTMSRALWGS